MTQTIVQSAGPLTSLNNAKETGLPLWPHVWHIVARSKDIDTGEICAGELAGESFVIFRSQSGSLYALDGHCPHMGAHLAFAEVKGEELRCALHHWRLDGQGRVHATVDSCSTDSCSPTRVWSVQERFGLVFLFPIQADPKTHSDLPVPDSKEQFVWTTAEVVELDTDWHSMMVNGFDLLHLHAVHKRVLLGPAKFTQTKGACLQMDYRSRVTGHQFSDLMMKWLSGDTIRVHQTCYGPIIVVESDLGRTQTSAVLGIFTVGNRVRAFGAFGVRPGLFAGLRLKIARWLFSAFLRRDFNVVQGMRLCVDVDDPGVQAVATFLRGLPAVKS